MLRKSIPSSWFIAPPLRDAALVAVYLAAYLALDWASYAYAFKNFNITPWNPVTGLSLALLLTQGLRFAPALFVARVLGDLLIREFPTPFDQVLVGAAVIAAGYSATAFVLLRLRLNVAVLRTRDVLGLTAVGLVAAAVVAVVYVLTLTATGLLPWEEFTRAALRRGVGDSIGIVTLTPFLLVHGRCLIDKAWRRVTLGIEPLLQAGSIALVTSMIFGLDVIDEFKFFYLLFLPVIWIAMRSGLAGATVGVLGTQVAIIAAARLFGDYTGATVTALQTLMFILAVTGLFLGSVVSERRRTEELLRDSEARLQTIVQTAPDGMVTVDETGAIESVNPAAERLFGFVAAAIVGHPVATILPKVSTGAALLLADGEVMARRRDGSPVAIDLTVSETRIGNRRLFVGLARDITHRKQIEARLAQKQAELAHVSRLSVMGEMASALAHEINQPLSAIINYTRASQRLLAAPQADPARVSAAMDKAIRQADRAGEIIRRLREFLSKGDSQSTIVSVHRIMEDAVGLSQASAGQAAIELRTEPAAALPALLVDNVQIEQVIVNLVRNGLEAIAQSNAVRREVVLSARRAGSDFVQVTVRDSGPGIPPEMADQIFTPFTTTKSTGMGLGLSISRSIVEAHGGRLWAETLSAGGTAFHCLLPIAPALEEHHA